LLATEILVGMSYIARGVIALSQGVPAGAELCRFIT